MGNHSHEHEQHGHNHSCEQDKGIETHYTTDLIVSEDIMQKAKELAELITTSSEVQYYKSAEKQINESDNVQRLINLIKKKQKEALAFETTFKNKEMAAKIDGEIEQLQNELDEIPIVSEFQQSQADLNYLLQLVMTVVRDTVSEKLTLEAADSK
jgi:cell fate (sporulation/competence/biofilm development) regulator YmcA (YheA/YmcA/DUF963 family)